jgi:integrase
VTIARHLAAISQAHKRAGLDWPTSHAGVRTVWQGIRRTIGVAQKKKAGTTIGEVRAMIDAIDAGLLRLRDRALILLGYAGALRRSELVALNVDDLTFVGGGVEFAIRRSTMDQVAAGCVLEVPFGRRLATCPVRAIRAWIEAAAIVEGPLYPRRRSPRERLAGETDTTGHRPRW